MVREAEGGKRQYEKKTGNKRTRNKERPARIETSGDTEINFPQSPHNSVRLCPDSHAQCCWAKKEERMNCKFFFHCWSSKNQFVYIAVLGLQWISNICQFWARCLYERCHFTDGDYSSRWCTLLSIPVLGLSLGMVRFPAKMPPFV